MTLTQIGGKDGGVATVTDGKLDVNVSVDTLTATDVGLLAGNNNIGDVDVASIAAGSNLIGKVDVSMNGATVTTAAPLAVSVRNIQAGDNNIGNVDIASAIPAGTNNIGDVDVASIAAGDNNIGNVDIASIAAGDNNIGNVDIEGALPAGDNNIGNVDIVTLPALAAGTNVIGKVNVVSMPSLYRSHTFAGAADDTTQDVTANPLSSFALQVVSAAANWTVSIQTSLDGSTFTTVLTHTEADLTGVTKFVTGKPARYWRLSCAALEAAGSALAYGLGM